MEGRECKLDVKRKRRDCRGRASRYDWPSSATSSRSTSSLPSFWQSSCSVLPREEAMACKWLTLRPAHHPDTLTQSVRYSQRDYQLQEGSPTIFWPKLCSILACWWVWRLVSSCGFTWGIRLWSSYQELGRERILPFLLYIYRGKLSLLLPSTFLGFLSQWMPSWRQA